jgi:glycosyltransferase involved in cell wall biosynthesis
VTATSASPRVSVVVPVFNAGRDLERALDSVEAQTWRDLEVIVVDDGSTDPPTLGALDRACGRPGVTVHRTENRGPAAARNHAIERARGAYVLPLDADDHLAPGFLERTARVLDAEPEAAVVHTWVGLVGGHHGTWRTGEFSLAALLARCTIHVSSLYRREVWTDVGGYDPRFTDGGEDWDFWLSAAARGWKGRPVPEVLAYYRRSASSRERRARAPGVAGRVMRTLVGKHRALYQAHVEDAMAGLYEHLAATAITLERFYDNPATRLALRLRSLVRRAAEPER